MKMRVFNSSVAAIVAAFFVIFSLASVANSQRRDFVNDEEAELIREYQEVDLRIDVLMKFIDRRLAAAGIPGHNWAPQKNPELWGAEPKGTRAELLYDVKRILQKAVDDIDDIASRENAAIEGNERSGKLFPKAVRNLAGAASRFKPIFQAELSTSKDEKEKGVLYDSIDLCDQIIEAASNLPKEPVKSGKKNSKN